MKKTTSLIFSKNVDGFKELNYPNLECLYDFSNENYALHNTNGEIIGWRDMSENNNHVYFDKKPENVKAFAKCKKEDDKIYNFLANEYNV